MPKVTEEPVGLRAFLSLGLDLPLVSGGTQAGGECPFCGTEGKFWVNVEKGLWDCKGGGCGRTGNPLTFLQHLWEKAGEGLSDWDGLAADRGLLSDEPLITWGVRQSPVGGEWLVPAWGPDGKFHNLYRRIPVVRKERTVWTLVPTPGVWTDGKVHGLFGVDVMDPSRSEVWLCEGPWDALALWETLRLAEDEKANVVAVPGCGVFLPAWAALFAGKDVVVSYDNDHPTKTDRGEARDGAGLAGARRAVGMLTGADKPPKTVRWVRWGSDGWDRRRKSGYDVRDLLTEAR